MEVGESANVRIYARLRWNNTGIALTAGCEYELTATGSWRDWKIDCGPAGYSDDPYLFLKLSRWLRRAPHADWFALVGTLDQQCRRAFVIGTGTHYKADADAILYCFANDVYLTYFNNSGSIDLTVNPVNRVL